MFKHIGLAVVTATVLFGSGAHADNKTKPGAVIVPVNPNGKPVGKPIPLPNVCRGCTVIKPHGGRPGTIILSPGAKKALGR